MIIVMAGKDNCTGDCCGQRDGIDIKVFVSNCAKITQNVLKNIDKREIMCYNKNTTRGNSLVVSLVIVQK
jgi:hypothetical protein